MSRIVAAQPIEEYVPPEWVVTLAGPPSTPRELAVLNARLSGEQIDVDDDASRFDEGRSEYTAIVHTWSAEGMPQRYYLVRFEN
jgi:hypothetical protein